MLISQDRKEEILSELGDIVGPTAASTIGNIACQQAATRDKFGREVEASQQGPLSRCDAVHEPLGNRNRQTDTGFGNTNDHCRRPSVGEQHHQAQEPTSNSNGWKRRNKT